MGGLWGNPTFFGSIVFVFGSRVLFYQIFFVLKIGKIFSIGSGEEIGARSAKKIGF